MTAQANLSDLYIPIIETFGQLTDSIEALRESLCIEDGDLPIWYQSPSELQIKKFSPMREQVWEFIHQLYYLDDQVPRSILLGPGLIAASQKTLDTIEKINQVKKQFKQAMVQAKNQQESILKNPTLDSLLKESIAKRTNTTAEALLKVGLSRLHLKQCYRTLPILPCTPKKIAWTWANTRSIKKITQQEAQVLLQKSRNKAETIGQLNKLTSLKPQEPLAIIQNLAPHLRVNITYPQESGLSREMLKGAVPIFYLYDNSLPSPKIIPPKPKNETKSSRLSRSDIKIDPIPFLPSIRAHRYLTGVEHEQPQPA